MKFPRNAKIFRGHLDVAPFAGVFFLLVMLMMLASLVYTPGARLELRLPRADGLPGTDKPSVSVAIDALDNASLKGKVVQIVPAADSASRTFLVKIDLPTDTHLRSGLFGRAEFSRGERQALLIPRSAVVERGQLQGIYVLDQNKVASLRYITLGKPSGAEVEVLAGLQDGEQLVAKPGAVDLNGKRIEVQ